MLSDQHILAEVVYGTSKRVSVTMVHVPVFSIAAEKKTNTQPPDTSALRVAAESDVM